jgi:hypothetical protein
LTSRAAVSGVKSRQYRRENHAEREKASHLELGRQRRAQRNERADRREESNSSPLIQRSCTHSEEQSKGGKSAATVSPLRE